jgi:predicted RNase H-like HicB family nuclease
MNEYKVIIDGYHVVIEGEGSNFGAYADDLPGTFASGKSLEQTIQKMHEVIQFHIEGLLLDGLPIPQPNS